MGTTATVFMYDKESNRYNGVYINYDGYIQYGVGEKLQKYWRNFEDVKQLCNGIIDIRSLGNSINDIDYFRNRITGGSKYDAHFRNLTKDEMEETGKQYSYCYVFLPYPDFDDSNYEWFVYNKDESYSMLDDCLN